MPLRSVFQCAVVAWIVGSPTQSIQAAARHIDVQHSRLTVFVYKAGLFSAFADDHTISAPISSGTVSDATPLSVSVVVNAADLKVLDVDLDPNKRAEVQRRMLGADVLDVARFPTITFESTNIAPSGQDRWTVSGRLTIHGVARAVTFSTARLENRYRGQVEIRQRDFGIEPIRIAGGTVRVKDALKIEFEIVAGE